MPKSQLMLWTEEAMVLSAIADQKLTLNEIFQDTSGLLESSDVLKSLLSRMVESGIIMKSREFAGIVGLVISQLKDDISTEVKEIPYSDIVNAIALVSQQLAARYGYRGNVSVFLTKEMSC